MLFAAIADHGNFDDQFFMDPALLAMYAGTIYYNNFPFSVEEGMVMEYIRKQM